MTDHRSLLQVQFQQQLQEKNDEINKLQRELETLRVKVHIVSTGLDGRIKVQLKQGCTLQKQIGCFNHRVIEDKLKKQWLRIYFAIA